MINKIIDGIVEAINTEFGDTYDIYTESIEQGLQEPCFFVSCISPTNETFLGNRKFRKNKFCIQYFPSTGDKYNECNNVMERLFDCLETITLQSDLAMGRKMNGEIVDSVLNFMVNFDMFMYKVQTLEEMETYSVNTDVRKDSNYGN